MNRAVTIRIPTEIRSELMALSRLEKKPLSDVVRECLRDYLAVRRFRQLRGKILPFAEAHGLLTDEDVFKKL